MHLKQNWENDFQKWWMMSMWENSPKTLQMILKWIFMHPWSVLSTFTNRMNLLFFLLISTKVDVWENLLLGCNYRDFGNQNAKFCQPFPEVLKTSQIKITTHIEHNNEKNVTIYVYLEYLIDLDFPRGISRVFIRHFYKHSNFHSPEFGSGINEFERICSNSFV